MVELGSQYLFQRLIVNSPLVECGILAAGAGEDRPSMLCQATCFSWKQDPCFLFQDHIHIPKLDTAMISLGKENSSAVLHHPMIYAALPTDDG